MSVIAFDPAQVTAAILAGGAGSRLGGRDKGLEPLAGRPLIAHVLAALQGQADRIVLCINRNAARYAQFGPTLSDAADGFHGPLAGIAAALAVCATPWLLTLPVDCPQPPHDLALRLHAAAGVHRAAAAHDGERAQPLFALYRRELAASASAALAQDAPVWRWQSDIGAVPADFSDQPQAFDNLNTRDDFHHWETRSHA
jgi:molybdenum cofactor guanylyltransferase